MKISINCLFLFLLLITSTSSSSTRGQIKVCTKKQEYKLEFNKEKICYKDKLLERELKELEKDHLKLVQLKEKIKHSSDSTRIAIK